MLNEAFASFRNALLVYSVERTPADWAYCLLKLASAMSEFGKADPSLLQGAFLAYRKLLAERANTKIKLSWSSVQNNLGLVLLAADEHEEGSDYLVQAIDAFRESLKEIDSQSSPISRANTMHNLGVALRHLGEKASDLGSLQEAIDVFKEVLLTKELPASRAKTQNSLGVALGRLGSKTSNVDLLKQSVDAFRAALLIYQPDETRDSWLLSQTNLGFVLLEIGKLTSDRANFEEAAKTLEAALQYTVQTSGNLQHIRAALDSALEQIKLRS